MRVRFTLEARTHIRNIFDYIDAHNPTAARRVIARIQVDADRLSDSPFLGRPGVVAGTRELPVSRLPYIIVYEIHGASGEVVVLGVYHGAQLRPGQV